MVAAAFILHHSPIPADPSIMLSSSLPRKCSHKPAKKLKHQSIWQYRLTSPENTPENVAACPAPRPAPLAPQPPEPEPENVAACPAPRPAPLAPPAAEPEPENVAACLADDDNSAPPPRHERMFHTLVELDLPSPRHSTG